MEDGEIDFLNHEVFSGTVMAADLPSSSSMESFFEEILRDTHACTHTHTCNPPGLDNVHTHTCFHTHTKILVALDNDKSADTSSSKPAQLMRRLQGQVALEADIARLKCLLADFSGQTDGELGVYPYEMSVRMDKTGDAFLQPLPGGYVLNSCNVCCDAGVPCLHPNLTSESEVAGIHHERREASARCDLMVAHCQGLKSDAATIDAATALTNEVSTVNQAKVTLGVLTEP